MKLYLARTKKASGQNNSEIECGSREEIKEDRERTGRAHAANAGCMLLYASLEEEETGVKVRVGTW